MSKNKKIRWIGISGTWHITKSEVEKDVRAIVHEIIMRGNGIIVGGALGVDYFALDEAMNLDTNSSQIKVILPSLFNEYITHLRMWASGYNTGDPPITAEEAEQLIAQLSQLKNTSPVSIIESSNIDAREINKEVYFARNTKIVELSDEIIAFQVNRSSGTQDVIDKARKLRKKVIVHAY